MIPIVTPSEMKAIDESSDEPIDVLIQRAGSAVAWTARKFLNGSYGKRVVVVNGKGNNGNDGRVAASYLRKWGIKTLEYSVDEAPKQLPICDLVIDAAYGTGIRGKYIAPATEAPVIAVDIPSGVDGLTGEVLGSPMRSQQTVTFQALKPGHLVPPGSNFVGDLQVIDLGLDISHIKTFQVQSSDISRWLPSRSISAHKWESACWIIGGSLGMEGALSLAAEAAQRAGSGYVRISTPGTLPAGPIESVSYYLPEDGWEDDLETDIDRFSSGIIGPGLAVSSSNIKSIQKTVSSSDIPLVVDGGAIAALGENLDLLRSRKPDTIFTPHDREFEDLVGYRPSPRRIEDVQKAAKLTNSIVLLKGPITVVANPEGRCLVVANGDSRLATAGTGDVLSGIIGAFLAQGVPGMEAAAMGAWIHAKAGQFLLKRGMVASDLINLIPEAMHETDMG
ncbi:MAG: NAD(P)H-hydrate dehydratase [Acidimicrobiales bacterium]|nr:NAD(P)H-hydrate dehydratase [Acidimicrobiales bacterium]